MLFEILEQLTKCVSVYRVNHDLHGGGRLGGDEPPPPYDELLEQHPQQQQRGEEGRSSSRSSGRRGRRRRRRNDSRDRQEAEAARRQEEEDELMMNNNNGDINGNSELVNQNIVLAEAQAARLEASEAEEAARALMNVMIQHAVPAEEAAGGEAAEAREEDRVQEVDGAVGGEIGPVGEPVKKDANTGK